MSNWETQLIQPTVAVLGGGVLAGFGWLVSRLMGHGTRITKTEVALKSLFDAITKLDGRATLTERAHVTMTSSLGGVRTTLATLDERSGNTSRTVERIDGRLEQLFSPTSAARARVPK